MRYIVALFVCVLSCPAFAQLDMKTYDFGVTAFGFHGLPAKRRITTFKAENEAIRVFEQILGAQGLSTKIQIRASGDVSNAAAFVDETGTRIIAYNLIFMEEIEKKTGRYWALISIMAHEVGHHLNFHTYVPGVPPPTQSHKDELEADYFSGHALARLGATLDDALAAMREISPLQETSTHPGRRALAGDRPWLESGQTTGTPDATGKYSQHLTSTARAANGLPWSDDKFLRLFELGEGPTF